MNQLAIAGLMSGGSLQFLGRRGAPRRKKARGVYLPPRISCFPNNLTADFLSFPVSVQ
jgi:hypothetical protein